LREEGEERGYGRIDLEREKNLEVKPK